MTPKHISDFPPDTRWAQGPGWAIAVTVADQRVYRVDENGVRELVFREKKLRNGPAKDTGD